MTYSLRELKEWNKKIEDKALELGLDFYPQEFEIIGFNEMIGYKDESGKAGEITISSLNVTISALGVDYPLNSSDLFCRYRDTLQSM